MEDLYVVTIVILGDYKDEHIITEKECVNLKSKLYSAQSGMISITNMDGEVWAYSTHNISKIIVQLKK